MNRRPKRKKLTPALVKQTTLKLLDKHARGRRIRKWDIIHKNQASERKAIIAGMKELVVNYTADGLEHRQAFIEVMQSILHPTTHLNVTNIADNLVRKIREETGSSETEARQSAIRLCKEVENRKNEFIKLIPKSRQVKLGLHPKKEQLLHLISESDFRNTVNHLVWFEMIGKELESKT